MPYSKTILRESKAWRPVPHTHTKEQSLKCYFSLTKTPTSWLIMSNSGQENSPKRKVLLAVDHSEHSLRAFNWYVDDLHKENSILYILHCQELPTLTLPPQAHATSIYEEWLGEARKTEAKNRDLLDSFKHKCESRNVKCELFLEHASSSGDALCQFIKEHKPNYVVIGSRGQGMVRRTVLGSVSDYVIHHSAVPVCVCPPGQ